MSRVRPGVRTSVTVTATAAMALVLSLTAVLLVVLLRTALVGQIDAAVRTRASDIAGLLQAGSLPALIPSTQDDNSLVQVFDRTGTVVAASADIQGESALALTSPSGTPTTLTTLPIGSGGPFRVLAQASGQHTIVVARSLQSTQTAVRSATLLLVEIFPVVLVLVAGITWLGVGRALAPLERIRRTTATIGAGQVLGSEEVGRECLVVRVDDPSRLVLAQALYATGRGPVPALQVVWSDEAGRWPWELCEHHRDGQEVLGVPWLPPDGRGVTP